MPPRVPLQIRTHSAEATHAAGRLLGELVEPGHVVGLVGGLGAGKTCLASGLAQGAGVPDDCYVSSPTFTLVNEYAGRVRLVHMDFYRLGEASELVEIGVDDYYRGDAVCLVEWFDRFPEDQPQEHLHVSISVLAADARQLQLTACGARHQALAEAWCARWAECSGSTPEPDDP